MVKSFDRMFKGNVAFSHDLSKWDIKSAESVYEMFAPDGKFPHACVKNWDFSNIKYNSTIFGARKKNQAFAKKILGKEVFKG